jgi:phosphate transport system substrate-binding protein
LQVILVNTPTDALKKVGDTPVSIYTGASIAQVVPQCKIKALSLRSKSGKLISPYQKPLVSTLQCNAKLHNQVNKEAIQDENYFLTSNLYVIVKENGKSEQLAGKAYANYLLSDEGQKLVEEAGFIRIRD